MPGAAPSGQVDVSSSWMNGFNVYGNSQKTGYPRAPKLMGLLGRSGARARYAVLVPQLFQFDYSGTDSTLNTPHYWCDDGTCPDQHCEAQSPDDEGLINAAEAARREGMAVVFKPHVDPYVNDPARPGCGGAGRAAGDRNQIKPPASIRNAWWDTYESQMMHYAGLAAGPDVGAQIFIVGTELSQATSNRFGSERMSKLIDDLHSAYPSLKLAYAANWDSLFPPKGIDPGDYFMANPNLDFSGVDAYFERPGTAVGDGGDAAAVAAAWGTKVAPRRCPPDVSSAGDSSLLRNPGQTVDCVRRLYGKPVILTELGYAKNKPNGVRGAYDFWTSWVKQSGIDGLDRRDYFDGIWWWNTPTSADPFSLLGNEAGADVCAHNGAAPRVCAAGIGAPRNAAR